MLSSYGLVTSRQGGGNYVVDKFAENVFEFMGFSDSLTADNYNYFFDCRLLFECGMTGQIISNVTDDDIQKLDEINQAFRKDLEKEQYVHAEINFHNAFLRLSKNPLVVELYTLVLKFMQQSAFCLLEGEAIRHEAYEAHDKIISALKARNEALCQDAVRKHLQIARDNLKHYFEDSSE